MKFAFAPLALSLACVSLACSSGGSGTFPSDAADDALTDGSSDAQSPADSALDTRADTAVDTAVDAVPSGCTPVEVGDFQYIAARSSDINALFQATLTTSIGSESVVDGINLNVVGMDSSVLSKTGTFELGVGVEANYSTAEHSMLVFEDPTSSGSVRKYFAASGQLRISSTTPPASVTTLGMKGRLSNVKFVEVTLVDSVSTPVPGGKCVYVADKLIDISP